MINVFFFIKRKNLFFIFPFIKGSPWGLTFSEKIKHFYLLLFSKMFVKKLIPVKVNICKKLKNEDFQKRGKNHFFDHKVVGDHHIWDKYDDPHHFMVKKVDFGLFSEKYSFSL